MPRPKAPKLSSEAVYTIGIAASKLGLTVHTLRQYEAEGLIIPEKTATARRIYSDLELEKVRCIKSMIHERGLNFEGIRQMLALIPCWKLKKCDEEKRNSCPAYLEHSSPCWAMKGNCSEAGDACRTCIVYRSITHCDDLRALLFEQNKN